ncbi:VRR-NUC domain-containing protein [Klebsiella phage BMac]|uniref:VRR-NUC domain-containing protein n=1 Tax=Klebsiella phage BMac TaxID=2935709 RepID=A0AAE9HNH7_9CAUD|nr:VRR-NUC domain-containing protein [Klebsiella phage BMac]
MITDKGDYLEYYGGPVKACPLEKIDQMNSVSWLRHEYPDYLFWHTVNEGSKHKASAVIDHQMGLLKGVSDILILIGFGGKYPFAAIELKRHGKAQASPVSKEQREFLAAVRRRGGFAAVAYGFEQFKIAFCDAIK